MEMASDVDVDVDEDPARVREQLRAVRRQVVERRKAEGALPLRPVVPAEGSALP